MRRRSIVAPLILILIGVLFLVNNMRPDMPLADIIAVYWPFLLIAWGVIRLAEVLWSFFQGRPMRHGLGGGEVVLVVFICLIGSGLFSAHRHGIRFGVRGLEMFGQPFEFTVSQQQGVPAGAGKIVFEPPHSFRPVGRHRSAVRCAEIGGGTVFVVEKDRGIRGLPRANQNELGGISSPVGNLRKHDRRRGILPAIGDRECGHQEIAALVHERPQRQCRKWRRCADVKHSRKSLGQPLDELAGELRDVAGTREL